MFQKDRPFCTGVFIKRPTNAGNESLPKFVMSLNAETSTIHFRWLSISIVNTREDVRGERTVTSFMTVVSNLPTTNQGVETSLPPSYHHYHGNLPGAVTAKEIFFVQSIQVALGYLGQGLYFIFKKKSFLVVFRDLWEIKTAYKTRQSPTAANGTYLRSG